VRKLGEVLAGDRTWLVAIAAAMWGLDGWLRLPLAQDLPAATVVFWEHFLVVLVLMPWVPRALRALRRCGKREWIAAVVLGGGTSVVATMMFTAAFEAGDPVTPLVLQKMQPVLAVVAAFVILRERIRGGYFAFAVPALLGAWLLAFTDPFDVRVAALRSALLALGAAALWGAGTVVGRLLSVELRSWDVTVLRFVIGLPAAALIVWGRGVSFAVTPQDMGGLALLAFIPGLIALTIYYYGMRNTAAARATLAELAFPATAALVGVTVLGESLSPTQWLGFGIVLAAVIGLGFHERTRETPAVVAETV